MGDTELKAPKGKFRVVGVDTFEGPFADYLIGDFDTKKEALTAAQAHGGTMNKTYVYTDDGLRIGNFGTF